MQRESPVARLVRDVLISLCTPLLHLLPTICGGFYLEIWILSEVKPFHSKISNPKNKIEEGQFSLHTIRQADSGWVEMREAGFPPALPSKQISDHCSK